MTTELGRLVSELIERTHECALAPDGYGCDAYLAQVAAEKALLEHVATLEAVRVRVEWLAKKWEQEGTATPFLRDELRRASHGLR